MEGYFKDSHLRADYEDLFREDEEKPSDVAAPERPDNGDETTTNNKDNIQKLTGQLAKAVADFNHYANEGLGDARTFSLKIAFSEICPFEMALSIIDKVGDNYQSCRIPFIDSREGDDIYDKLDSANGIVMLLAGILAIVKGGDENDTL